MTANSDLPLFTSDIKQEVQIKYGDEEFSKKPAMTVMQVFDKAIKERGNKPALHAKYVKPGKKAADTPWTTINFNEYRAMCDSFGKACISLGMEKFDIINIIGFNSVPWFVSNFGAMTAGCVPAGIYATNLPQACLYIGKHSESKVIVCDGVKQLEKYYEISKEMPSLKALVMYGMEDVPADAQSKVAPGVKVYKFDEFLKVGKDVPDSQLKERSDSWKAGEVASLIYTSGTTGDPKAVMLTNDNLTWTAAAISGNIPRPLNNTDCMISYLPLSHIAAQILDMYNNLHYGTQIYFAQPDALKGSLGATLKEVRPTWFFGVPRVWEKIYEKLQEVARSSTGIKKKLSTFAKGKAFEYWDSREFGKTPKNPFLYGPVASKLLKKAHVQLGFDRCIRFYVAAAPIDVKILRYFASINIPIMEIFGQSECTGPHSISSNDAFIFGKCGRQMLGTESRLEDGTGELCYRGRHIFAGYMKMPDKTRETIDPEGWLHSGDVVDIDKCNDPRIKSKPSGFIKITGRIKELIITSGGENVPPVLIEEQLKNAMPALSNAMVIGDKRKFLTVLLCLLVEVDDDGVPSNKLTGEAKETSKRIGSTATTTEEVMKDPLWKDYLDKGLAAANKKATSQAQRVGKWSVLPTDFSEGGGELTPTLKLKRAVTATKYADIIDALYA